MDIRLGPLLGFFAKDPGVPQDHCWSCRIGTQDISAAMEPLHITITIIEEG